MFIGQTLESVARTNSNLRHAFARAMHYKEQRRALLQSR
jgi:uncharacterized protein YjiS (DUF1127 family)